MAAARMGCETLLLTHSLATLGQMSCNPAIGGIGKSQLVREVDALGGAMARATDRAGIQFRVLNARKGPAVRATRAQADRALYRHAIRTALERQPRLRLHEAAVDDISVAGGRMAGVVTADGATWSAPAVVLTAGTFLGGRIHIGLESRPGGRAGDPPSIALAERLRAMAFRVARLKTGTPPRIDASTVNYAAMREQWGDEPRPTMSYLGDASEHPEQRCCWLTHTNERTHGIIREGLERSPLHTGAIEGIGPRYCPSVEDKVHRFADKSSHQVFVEPEGLSSGELYPNGISTSLPLDIQQRLVNSIAGLESARLTRPGYAIEYDFLDPRDLDRSLQTRALPGLFFAGQINGTTGYEEAAAQGLLAGANAALLARGEESWYPRRDEAYLGVLVDDLVAMGATEPYRMFTSRAEYRLSLREDNADLRLTEHGRRLGLVDDERWLRFERKREAIAAEQARMSGTWVRPGSSAAAKLDALLAAPLTHACNLAELLRRPELDYRHLAGLADGPPAAREVAEQVQVQAKYAGYIERQSDEIERLRLGEATPLPAELDFATIEGLSTEVKSKLGAARPATLAQAARIPGVTPAALSLLRIHLARRGAPRRRSA